jgi:hypothetical protein
LLKRAAMAFALAEGTFALETVSSFVPMHMAFDQLRRLRQALARILCRRSFFQFARCRHEPFGQLCW